MIEISGGKLSGALNKGVHVFKGISYGAPTGGAARFLAPKPAAPWAGVREAIAYGAPTPQGEVGAEPLPNGGGASLTGGGEARYSEECLFLNVWTPATDNAKRPVMVWLHGGGFSSGSGGSIMWDGTNLAKKQDVVVVTINHRLNAFGYCHLEELFGADYADSALSGMLDIVLALEWVRDNIAGFGGDAGCVTIFGESGGGRKTSTLMAMPRAQGLFHRCVVQSGSQLRVDTKSVATERAAKLLSLVGVKSGDRAALEKLDTDTILAAVSGAVQGYGQFRPVAGAPSLPSHPFDPGAPAISKSMPMLIGTNRTEASLRMANDRKITGLDEAGLIERLARVVPAKAADQVAAMYQRLYPQESPGNILMMAATDRGYFLDSTIQAERKTAQGGAPVFYYGFYRETPVAGGRMRAPHASEIAFVFDNLAQGVGYTGPITPESQKLADIMSAAWAAFARTGNPSTPLLDWPIYGPDRTSVILDYEPRIENDPRGEQRRKMLSFGSQQDAERELAPM